MMKTEAMDATLKNDAELVAENLAGNKEAFRQIVVRHGLRVKGSASSCH
jgi:hypothetical protein